MMGGMNLHLPITFTDGVKWLARIRRTNATSPPPELQNYILMSEIATLRFLETVNIPTPRVYDYSVEGEDSPAGVSYILMDFMPGAVLDWSTISEEGHRKVIAQLADIYIELGKHRFPTMGCMDQIGTKHIGPLTRECLTDFTDSSEM
jgi:aminoglycoside phosphotransferase (APT) family kinase protein